MWRNVTPMVSVVADVNTAIRPEVCPWNHPLSKPHDRDTCLRGHEARGRLVQLVYNIQRIGFVHGDAHHGRRVDDHEGVPSSP